MPRSRRNLALYFLILFVAVTLAAPKKPKIPETLIGIDIGTTYSRVGVLREEHVEIIPIEKGNMMTPSSVAFTDTETLIGEAAAAQASDNRERTIVGVKRLIGRKFDDPEIQRDIMNLPYKVINKDGKPYIQVKVKDGEVKAFSPEEILAMIIHKMKETAEMYLGYKVNRTVVTLPVAAYFDDTQRQAIKDACVMAWLNVARILMEPTATAIAHGLDRQRGEQNILVYKLGGETFDVSTLDIDNGLFEVLSTSGDTHLGGEVFNDRIMDYFIRLIKEKYNKDISKNQEALGKLRRECEKAKRALSSQHQVKVEIEALDNGVDFSEPLTRAKFEELNIDLFNKTMSLTEKALGDAGLKKTDIHQIVIAGGSTRIPKIQRLLKEFFDGKEPNKGVNPDEATAYGAAVQGDIISRDEFGEIYFSPCCSFLIPHVPLGLGIETAGGVMTKVIERNTYMPANESQIFSTYRDQQSTVEIKVFEGDRTLTKDCHELGRFHLSGIAPVPRGVPQIEVTFEVDYDGIIHVTAEDKVVKNKQTMTITNDKRIHEDKIHSVRLDAMDFFDEDELLRERVGTGSGSKLEPYVYNMKIISGNKLADKIDAAYDE